MSPRDRVIVRVIGPSFVAGIEIDPRTRLVIDCAPILARLARQHGMRWDDMRTAMKRRGWTLEIVSAERTT